MTPDPNTAKEADDLEQSLTSDFDALDKNPPKILFHYTTPDGLLGILKTEKLWFSQTGFLNDSVEATYAHSLICTAIDERLKSPPTPAVNELLLRARKSADIFGAKSSAISSYIACFCEEGDLLSQWRGYGSSGVGFSIGMQAQHLEASAHGDMKSRNLIKVIYNAQEQRDYIGQCLDKFCELVLAWQEAGWEPERNDDLELAHRHLRLTLAQAYLRFKHPGFKEEQEWRLLLLKKPDSDGLSFRAAGARLIPYLEIDMRKMERGTRTSLPIASITCGPSLHPELTIRALDLRLSQTFPKGSVALSSSTAPFRP
nr:DUF2971 domain-containing protein [Myxococcus sp. CA040A]